jgi:hypothetical protein
VIGALRLKNAHGPKMDLRRLRRFTSAPALQYRARMRRTTIKSAIKTTMPAGLGGSRAFAA